MRSLLLWLSVCLTLSAATDEGLEFFETKIRPVLATHCYACHSSKLKQPMGELALDTKEGVLRGGKSGVPAIIPGKPEESILIRAIEYDHKDLRMPPGKALPPQVVEDFKRWIKMGAPDPRVGAAAPTAPKEQSAVYDWEQEKKHWAYQPLRKMTPPLVSPDEWNRTIIDRFIKAKLDEKGLKPLPRAGKRELLRRVTYDLTGLPPTPEEMQAFLADSSPQAFEKVVDRLLASPAYGEHWGRHWLDIVRYADTAGDAADFPVPEMYRYRNYVIRSFQRDKPYDDFLREQIAGDLLKHKDDEDRADKLIATGYIAAARRFGQSLSEFHLTIDDTIDNLGKAVLALSTGCARCHDHKYDPIPTRDYYALAGIFLSTKYAMPGMEHNQYLEGFLALKTEDAQRLEKLQDRMKAAFRIVKSGIGSKPDAKPEERIKYLEAAEELSRIRENWPDIAMIYGISDGEPKNARIMIKGDPKTLGPEVPRGFLTILGGQTVPEGHCGSGRELLAEWLTDPRNPLTARVMVNRVWLWHFGRGIVNTPNDFGKRGELPTHPELLDYLASFFTENGWSLKKLHREILLTRVYQSASGYDEANALKDPKNEYYWRFDRRRLSAEELRDSMLAVSGQLDPVPGGPFDFGPRGSFRFTQHKPFLIDFERLNHNKRSVYLPQQRFRPHPYLDLFDGADTNNMTAARTQSVTAAQALFSMNNPFVEAQAAALAARVGIARERAADRLRYAYQLLFQRDPSAEETRLAMDHLDKARKEYMTLGAAEPDATRGAWVSLLRVLMGTNEFFYID